MCLGGKFGSGFVYVDSNGNNYIITNHHVIDTGLTASVEFEDADGNPIKYDNLSVVAVDDEIDIAVLKFADSKKPFSKGLKLSSAKVTDGMEVYSAGFPGLGNKPVWQLGKGIVTNSNTRIKELLDPSISSIIQHSAEVDSGNSGGPLLITSKESSGYEVIGINTWKATYRQNTNYAIPSKVINDFINSRVLSSNNNVVAKAEKHNEMLIKILNNEDKDLDFTDFAKYVSLQAVYESGTSSFIDILKYAPSNVRNLVSSVFSSSPIEGLKYAIAYNCYKNYKIDENGSKYVSDKTESKDNKIEIAVKNGDDVLLSVWVNENGNTHFVAFGTEKNLNDKAAAKDKDKKKDKERKSNSEVFTFIGLDNPSSADINAGITFGLGKENVGTGLAVSLDVWTGDVFGVELGYTRYFKEKLNSFCIGPTIRIPLDFNSMFISPVAKADIGMSLAENLRLSQFKAEAGVEFIFPDILENGLGIGISYSYQKFKVFGGNDFGNTNTPSYVGKGLSSINIYGKFCF